MRKTHIAIAALAATVFAVSAMAQPVSINRKQISNASEIETGTQGQIHVH